MAVSTMRSAKTLVLCALLTCSAVVAFTSSLKRCSIITTHQLRPVSSTIPNINHRLSVAVDAPQVVEKQAMSLAEMRKFIPEKAFEKNAGKSLLFMGIDFALWGASFLAMQALVNSSLWLTLPFAAKALASVVYWNVAGLFMWCQFVAGHDCGHGTFSNSKLLNDVMGHISHGSLLVPFYPWQLSHRRHHMFHNHVKKDYSYSWYTPDILSQPNMGLVRFIENNRVIKFFLPFFGWFSYLLGFGDGSHILPIPDHRLWKNTPKVEYLKCLISSAVVGAYATGIYFLLGQSLQAMAFYYLAPLIVFGWWLVTVTYLQHHGPSTLVYDDHDFKFAEAAFETVDREYGLGIDSLTHHITNHHVAHHLFFTHVPHYNLPMATEGVKNYLKEKKLDHMYRFEKTHDFPIRVHKYMMDDGFKAIRADPVNYPNTSSA